MFWEGQLAAEFKAGRKKVLAPTILQQMEGFAP
jgi:hypothetical protein